MSSIVPRKGSSPYLPKKFWFDAKHNRSSFWGQAYRKFLNNKSAFFSLLLLITLVIGSLCIPYFSTYTYYETVLKMKNLPPSWEHLFGTDELGRDVFVRVWWGARISLFVGITAALLDVVIGVVYGAIAGYCGGKIDEILMRFVDIFHSLPNLILVILLMMIFGSGIFTIIIALGITGWINMARITRGQVLKVKQREYVLASQMFGATPLWIIQKHLIPNIMSSIITTLTFTIPTAIFTETFLSFLGLGVQAPIASWGTMASDGLYSVHYFPWRLFFPSGFICITMLAFNLLGDGIRDAFDPRS